jgi:OAA-family lectin sugar binding domain
MSRRIAIATLALMVTTLSFASAGDRYEGLAGSYKEKSGGEMKIRKADDNKKEAGPWRFVMKGEGDWPCAEGQDNPGGGKPTTYFIEFSAGKYKGERYNIVRDKDGELKELQLVGGSKAIWVKQSGTVFNEYTVEAQWGGKTAPWRADGTWVIGGRAKQRLVAVQVTSKDDGKTLTGTMTYKGEEPISFKGTLSAK